MTGASSLFSAGVPERVMQSRTGHSSIDALRKYERVTLSQELAVSKILSGQEDLFKQQNEELLNSSVVTVTTNITADIPLAISTTASMVAPILLQLLMSLQYQAHSTITVLFSTTTTTTLSSSLLSSKSLL